MSEVYGMSGMSGISGKLEKLNYKFSSLGKGASDNQQGVERKSKLAIGSSDDNSGKFIRSSVTPECIEAKRAARLLKNKKVNMSVPEKLEFNVRPLLYIEDYGECKRLELSIMTYNCLAQSLIRRSLYPTSGDALKWNKRSKILIKEVKQYNPDVICLQEIDCVQYQTFWCRELENLNYCSQLHSGVGKSHGLVIGWKREMFEKVKHMVIDYDNELTGIIEPRTVTKNIGLILALRFSDRIKLKFPETNKSGIVVGTTHLFWHQFGTYDRTRQVYVLLYKMKEFMSRIDISDYENDCDSMRWYVFLCGDFNSQPYDTPYLSMVSKPVKYCGKSKAVIECSVAHKFSNFDDGNSARTEVKGTLKKPDFIQPDNPTPDKFEGNEEQKQLVQYMEELHNSLDMRAISLYSVAYKYVHPENAGLDNDRGEPEISNWAHSWRGLLDYIMFVTKWNFDKHVQVDLLHEFEAVSGLKIKALLRMPTASEMPKHGQPHIGEYPSDHLSMMCKLELGM